MVHGNNEGAFPTVQASLEQKQAISEIVIGTNGVIGGDSLVPERGNS